MDHKVIAVGSDIVGDDFLNAILSRYLNDKYVVRDVRFEIVRGSGYMRTARQVATILRDGLAWRGVLVCGTGIGVSIAANRMSDIRAAVCHDLFSVHRSVFSNNCQIICLGSRVIAIEYAIVLLNEWFQIEFDPATPSAAKIAEIDQ